MRRTLFGLLLIVLLASACTPTTSVGEISPPFIDTGVDPDSWAQIPAGEFPYGQHDHMTMLDEYQIMVTDVTNQQYVDFINQALADGTVSMGDVDVEEGGLVKAFVGIYGYYPGEPFDGYKHEEVITEGDKLFLPVGEEGLHLSVDGDTFSVSKEFSNHPVTMVTWFGANAYCEYYGWRLPSEAEWEKAARGTELVDGYGLPFAWGTEIHPNSANYYSSSDLFEKIYGKLGNTTPVGFYNGQTYDGYETRDSASPYGLYDMGGNVWQWVGDDLPDQHYRYMKGGSYYTYEVDLRVWKSNNAGPTYFSPAVGFRCSRDE